MTTTMAQPGLAPDINLFEAMDIFKNFPDEELPKYRNDPKLALVAAAEMDRRLRIRKDFESRSQKPSGPVVDQIQQQLLAPPQGIAQGMDQQPMGQPMGQPQEMQQPQPAIGMASGGPVAFAGGGMGLLADPRSGIYPQSQESEEDRKKRLLREIEEKQRSPNVPGQVSAILAAEAARLKDQPKPAAPANALTQQSDDPGKTSQDALIASILAGRQPTSSAVAAPAPTLGGLARIAKDYIPEINPPMSPEEKRKIEDEEVVRYQQRFPDKVSPIMEELAKAAGQQVSPEEARRRAFMKAGIAGLGYTGRDFGAGVAGMLEGYQGTKEGIEAANKEAKMNELKARLAGEQYKDALKRKDFESARKYAEEQAIYKEKAVDARNQYKRDTLGIMAAVQGLTKPSKVGGAGEAKGSMTASKLADIREKAIERAQPELQRLDSEFDKRAEEWFFSSTKLPKAWRTGSDEKSRKAQEEYAERRKQILDKYTNEVLDVFRAANPLVITKEQAQAIASGKK